MISATTEPWTARRCDGRERRKIAAHERLDRVKAVDTGHRAEAEAIKQMTIPTIAASPPEAAKWIHQWAMAYACGNEYDYVQVRTNNGCAPLHFSRRAVGPHGGHVLHKPRLFAAARVRRRQP